MRESVSTMKDLLDEIQILIHSASKADQRDAVRKLQRVAAIASTLAFTVICSKH